MATCRRIGTNEDINTYDSGGGSDYSDLETWEQATDIDCVGGTISPVLEVKKGVHADRDAIDGATTDSTYFRIIRAYSGDAFREIGSGLPATDGTCAAFVYTVDESIFKIKEDYDQVQDLVLQSNTAEDYKSTFEFRDCDAAKLICCAVLYMDGGGTNQRLVDINCSGETAYVIGCLLRSTNIGILMTAGTGYIYNTTVDDCTSSITIGAGDTANSKNCIYVDGASNNGTHNVTTCIDSDTPTFVNAAGLDYHLQYSDSLARENGTDLSADGSFAFDDDVDGHVRTGTWDIGAYQYHWLGIFNGLNARTGGIVKINGVDVEDIHYVNGV